MIELELKRHFLNALELYTSKDFFDFLVFAKGEFSKIAGVITEDEDSYEAKMRAFNEWYIFDYIEDGQEDTLMKSYLKNHTEISDDKTYSLLNTHYSLIVYIGKKGKKYLFEDLVMNEKYYLTEELEVPVMVEEDLFTGRMIVHNHKGILLDGLTLIPKDMKQILLKYLKKCNTIKQRVDFLRRVEQLTANWSRFRHIDAKRYFSPEKLSL